MTNTTWHALHSEFKALAGEQRRLLAGRDTDGRLYVHLDYANTDDCYYRLSRGANEEVRTRFEWLAAQAGRTLAGPNEANPFSFWIRNLFLDLLRQESQLLLASNPTGGVVKDVVTASMIYCNRLQAGTAQQIVDKKRVEARLREKGLSLRQWASAANVDVHTATDYLNGQTKPRPDSLANLAKVIDLDLPDRLR